MHSGEFIPLALVRATQRQASRTLAVLLAVIALPIALCTLAAAQQAPKPAAAGPTYAHDIRPILEARCTVCHNRAAAGKPAVSGRLALDSYAALRAGAGGRAILDPGTSAGSDLIERLEATSPTRMMPRGGPPLPREQIALFRRWIDAGAPRGDERDIVAARAASDPDAAPMPRDPKRDEVRLPTRVALPPDLAPKAARPAERKNVNLELALRIGPLPAVTALAYSPNGKLLAVGEYRSVVLWDTVVGHPLGEITHLAGTVMSLAFRPDGAQLAVAGGLPATCGEARVYNVPSLQPAGPPLAGLDDVVNGIAWSADGTRLATAGQDKTARLWEWPSGKQLRVFSDHADAVTCVCFAPDGKSLYTASQDHNVRRFDTMKGDLIRTFSGNGEEVTALTVSPDGRALVSAGAEPRLRWWNLDNGDTVRYSDGHGGPVNAVVFSHDGKFLASASGDRTVRLWDAGGGGHKRALQDSRDWVYAVAISPDGKLVAGAGADGVTRIWEAANGRLRLSLAAWPMDAPASATDWIAITPEGYYDGSEPWDGAIRAEAGDKALTAPRIAAFVPTLHDAKRVGAAWQAAALDPATIPAQPAGPSTPGGKAAAAGVKTK